MAKKAVCLLGVFSFVLVLWWVFVVVVLNKQKKNPNHLGPAVSGIRMQVSLTNCAIFGHSY